MVPRKLDIK